MSAYKTESVAKQQASKKHGKNWMEKYSILETDEGFVIEEKLPELPQENEENLDENLPQSNGVCSALFGAMLNPVAPEPAKPKEPKKEAEKTVKTIEQNRPEQNGLKRPSKGSTCCIIWDTCDKIMEEKGSPCTSAELFNALQGYNECTLRTQYARWRQFNGVTGRLPGQNKTVKLPEDFEDAKFAIKSKLDENETGFAAKVEALKAINSANELISWIANNL